MLVGSGNINNFIIIFINDYLTTQLTTQDNTVWWTGHVTLLTVIRVMNFGAEPMPLVLADQDVLPL